MIEPKRKLGFLALFTLVAALSSPSAWADNIDRDRNGNTVRERDIRAHEQRIQKADPGMRQDPLGVLKDMGTGFKKGGIPGAVAGGILSAPTKAAPVERERGRH